MMISKAKTEALKLRREANSNKKDGVKKMSRVIGDEPANRLLCVKRDGDIAGGGKKGEIVTNLEEIDVIVKRAWNKSMTAWWDAWTKL